jgi:Tol biopolymer transport system component
VAEVKGKEMRKTISILVLLAILCSSSISCRKKNVVLYPNKTKVEDSIGPNDGKAKSAPIIEKYSQDKILFTAKQKGVMNIVKLDIVSKTKQIVSTIPFCPEEVQLSSDNKKFTFRTVRNVNDIEYIDIYTMNIDGSDLKNISENFLNKESQQGSFGYCFSPDNQQIILTYYTRDKDKKSKPGTIYIQNMYSPKAEVIKTDHPLYAIYLKISYLHGDAKETIRTKPGKNEFIFCKDKEIGFFSWSTREFVPIFQYSELIEYCKLSPDRNHVLFTVKKGEKSLIKYGKKSDIMGILYGLFDYNIKTKSVTQILTSELLYFTFWLPDSNQFLYEIGTGEVGERNFIKPAQLFLFNFYSRKSELIYENSSVESLQYIEDSKLVNSGFGIDGGYLEIFDLKTKSVEHVPANRFQNVFVQNTDLLVFTTYGFFLYDTKTKQNKMEMKEKILENDANIQFPVVSLDKTKFYFINHFNLYVYSINGKLFYKHTMKSNSFYKYPEYTPYLTGFFSTNDEVTFIEFVNNKTDLFCYDQNAKKAINLTENLGVVHYFKLSPDQQSVAVLTKNPLTDLFSIDIIDISSQIPIKRIASFPEPYYGEIAGYHHFNSEELFEGLIFVSFDWSKDNQYFFYTCIDSTNLTKDRPSLTLNRIKTDGTNFKTLTDPKDRSMKADLSPDGNQIVYLSGDNNVVTIMNSDGTEKMSISLNITKELCYLPVFSPDGNMIVFFYQENGTENGIIAIVNKKGKLIKKYRSEIDNYNDLFSFFKTNQLFSEDCKNVIYSQRCNYEKKDFMSILIKNSKEEINLKGFFVCFRWSPTSSQLLLLLLESKEKDQINQLTLYDTSSNTYTSISQDVQQLFDACWSPDGKQILYAGTDSKTGQIVFKTSNPDGSNQKLLFTFGENPLERPSSIENIEKLMWLK